jgi:Ala-tRNA(Pro) deacylase
MAISAQLSRYLERHGASYEVCAHIHSHSSAQTARTAHVPPQQLAKSVVLEDEAGCLVAVIPADKVVMLGEISRVLGRKQLHLADEDRIAALFEDCDRGAVPAVGMAWGVETIIDDELEAQDPVYIEGGDHERLLKMSHGQFHALMHAQKHGRFSKTPTH